MRVLGIDTATRTGALALLDGAQVIWAEQALIRPGGSEKLPALLAEAMEAAAVSPEELELIAVGVGPGSYTGVRVGLAIAKGLAFGLKVPLVGVSTLQALAANIKTDTLVCPLVKSRKGEVYAGLYQWQGAQLVELAPPAIWGQEELASKLKAQGERIVFLGEELDEYYTYLAHYLKEQARFGQGKENLVDAAAVARLGLAEWEKNKENQLYTVLPLYLRRTEAEIRWAERGCPG
ncbi:MAG: tRNA (adenosine(37)-N6)-threonylcarbamoyltransferase complex dimerization subunit type 1 TsaB [Firmicutes bacterium]|nr:tRNA (adenosine(37)-N6)-threonylcarbamoyltransferase complex dimerization subunit type 1 TsaB [Bacillota bacterium]